MRIAQIICTFPPYKGGMGNSVYHFSRGLAALGHEITVFTPAYPRRADLAEKLSALLTDEDTARRFGPAGSWLKPDTHGSGRPNNWTLSISSLQLRTSKSVRKFPRAIVC